MRILAGIFFPKKRGREVSPFQDTSARGKCVAYSSRACAAHELRCSPQPCGPDPLRRLATRPITPGPDPIRSDGTIPAPGPRRAVFNDFLLKMHDSQKSSKRRRPDRCPRMSETKKSSQLRGAVEIGRAARIKRGESKPPMSTNPDHLSSRRGKLQPLTL